MDRNGNDQEKNETGENSLNRSMSKDPKKDKKTIILENKAKIDNLFAEMKNHELNYLLNQPILESHPSYESVKANFMTLS